VHTAILNKSEGGVGIINTKNRLQLLYANNYELRIDDQEKDFSVYLKLHLYD
jgi:sensor histidine kinase YesM